MKQIEDYLENTDQNNRMIQQAIREIDMDSLYDLCASLKENKEVILRNLSERVRDEVLEYLKKNEFKIPDFTKKRANFIFSKYLLYFENNSISDLKNYLVSELSFETIESTKKSLITVYFHNIKGDLKTLSTLIGSIKDRIIRKQLEMILYGRDPLKGEYLLDKLNKKKLEEEKRKADIIKEGILSILSEETAIESLFEKLNVSEIS